MGCGVHEIAKSPLRLKTFTFTRGRLGKTPPFHFIQTSFLFPLIEPPPAPSPPLHWYKWFPTYLKNIFSFLDLSASLDTVKPTPSFPWFLVLLQDLASFSGHHSDLLYFDYSRVSPGILKVLSWAHFSPFIVSFTYLPSWFQLPLNDAHICFSSFKLVLSSYLLFECPADSTVLPCSRLN